jgi:hypothetical protein
LLQFQYRPSLVCMPALRECCEISENSMLLGRIQCNWGPLRCILCTLELWYPLSKLYCIERAWVMASQNWYVLAHTREGIVLMPGKKFFILLCHRSVFWNKKLLAGYCSRLRIHSGEMEIFQSPDPHTDKQCCGAASFLCGSGSG